MIDGSTYAGNGVLVWRMETDASIMVRNGGDDHVYLDENGFACNETGKPKCYELASGESISIQKFQPTQSNAPHLLQPALTLGGVMAAQPSVGIAKPKKPKKVDIPVEAEGGRHIALEEL